MDVVDLVHLETIMTSTNHIVSIISITVVVRTITITVASVIVATPTSHHYHCYPTINIANADYTLLSLRNEAGYWCCHRGYVQNS